MPEGPRSVMSPSHCGLGDPSPQGLRYQIGATVDRVARPPEEQVRRGLALGCDGEPVCREETAARAAVVPRTFIARLPEVRRMLVSDVQAAYEGDPAATSVDEAIFCYPGVK